MPVVIATMVRPPWLLERAASFSLATSAAVRIAPMVELQPWRSAEMYRPVVSSLRAGYIATNVSVSTGPLGALGTEIAALEYNDTFVFGARGHSEPQQRLPG